MTEYRSRFGNKSPTSQPPVKQETSGQMLNDEARKLLEEKSKAAARASLKAAEAGGRKTVEAGKAALEKFKGWRASKAKAGVATDSNVEPPALVEASPPVATIEDLRDGYDQTIAVPMSFSVAMDGQDDRELARGIEQEWDLSRESGVLVQDGKGSLHQDLTHRLDTLVSPESAPLTELSCRDAADALNAEPVESALADFIELGKAAGRLTKKHFPDAPDEGVVLGLTGDDLSKHYLLFG